MNAILQARVLYHGHKKWAQEHIFATQSHYHNFHYILLNNYIITTHYYNLHYILPNNHITTAQYYSLPHPGKQSHYHSSLLQPYIFPCNHLGKKKKNSLFVITAHYYILPTAITLSKLTIASSTTLHAITLSHLQRLTNTTNYSQPSPFEQLVQHTTKWEPVRAGVISCALLQDFWCHVTMCPAVGTDQTENLWDLLIQLYISQKIADTLKRCT